LTGIYKYRELGLKYDISFVKIAIGCYSIKGKIIVDFGILKNPFEKVMTYDLVFGLVTVVTHIGHIGGLHQVSL
jgi:hypothetical protein